MRRTLAAAVVALAVPGCDSPIDPSKLPPHTDIRLGETVRGQVTTEFFQVCGTARVYCKQYWLTAPLRGLLEVVLILATEVSDTATLGYSVVEPNGHHLYPNQSGPERRVSLQVSAGALYRINLYSETASGEDFELRTSIQ